MLLNSVPVVNIDDLIQEDVARGAVFGHFEGLIEMEFSPIVRCISNHAVLPRVWVVYGDFLEGRRRLVNHVAR